VLNVQITHEDDAVEMAAQDREALLAQAAWRARPAFPAPGRTAWHVLAHPARRPPAAAPLRAAKLKGVGIWHPRSYVFSGVMQGETADEPRPPSTEEYEPMGRLAHIGFAPDGEYRLVYSDRAPFGGILHDRAAREHRAATILRRHGVPAMEPYLVVRYPELRFQGEPMGAVITLSPTPEPYRAHVDYVDRHGEAAERYFERLFAALGLPADQWDERRRVEAIGRLGEEVGRVLRAMAGAGLYRYSSWFENFHFSLETGQLLLTDLDSTAELALLPPECRVLQILRDLGGAVYKVLRRFYHVDNCTSYTYAVIREADPLARLVQAYFPHASSRAVAAATAPLWNYFAPYLFLRKRHSPALATWDVPRQRSYEMEMDLFHVLAITLLHPLYAGSDLARRYPTRLDQPDLLRRAERYLGERFQYLEHVLCLSEVPAASSV
jgi:hypothetical protein